MNLALAFVSDNAIQVDRTQNHEGRELRGAPWMAGSCARQKDRYASAHVRGKTDDDRARVVHSVTATWFPGLGQ